VAVGGAGVVIGLVGLILGELEAAPLLFMAGSVCCVGLSLWVTGGARPQLRRVAVERRREVALVVAVGRARRLLATAAPALFAIGGVLLAAVDRDARLVGVLVFIVFGGMAVIALLTVGGPHRFVLARSGLRWDAGPWQGKLVTWDELAGAQLHPGPARLMLQPYDGKPVTVPVYQMELDPQRVYATVMTYLRHPELRAEIGTDASIRRITA
jgi:hypothetical protein